MERPPARAGLLSVIHPGDASHATWLQPYGRVGASSKQQWGFQMLKVPRIGGSAQLRLFADELGFDQACRAVQVHATTMRRWLRDDGDLPASALQALYWLTSWGFSDAAAEVHWSHAYLAHCVRELQAALAWRAPAHWGAGNGADYCAPGLVPLQQA